MAKLNEIKFVDWQPKLNHIGEVSEGIDDINQCIAVILTTQKGSVPHRLDFGSNIHLYLDYPVKQAVPNIIRETVDALNQWETRIDIDSVKVEIIESTVKIKIQWTLKNSSVNSQTEVVL